MKMGKNNINFKSQSNGKERAEKVLSQLGIPMSTAINMYLNQTSLTDGISFSISLPKTPASMNADLMILEEFYQKLEKGYDDIAVGSVPNAAKAFLNSRKIIEINTSNRRKNQYKILNRSALSCFFT